MNARIRYGQEADVVAGMSGEDLSADEMNILRSYGRTVLSFSNRVRKLPDKEKFGEIMTELEIIFKPDELEQGNSPLFIPGTRLIEVVNHQMVDLQILHQLSRSLLMLARDEGSLHRNGAYFIDHSTFPEGVYIGFYNPLTDSIEEL